MEEYFYLRQFSFKKSEKGAQKIDSNFKAFFSSILSQGICPVTDRNHDSNEILEFQKLTGSRKSPKT
jgi:hypothetical protein